MSVACVPIPEMPRLPQKQMLRAHDASEPTAQNVCSTRNMIGSQSDMSRHICGVFKDPQAERSSLGVEEFPAWLAKGGVAGVRRPTMGCSEGGA